MFNEVATHFILFMGLKMSIVLVTANVIIKKSTKLNHKKCSVGWIFKKKAIPKLLKSKPSNTRNNLYLGSGFFSHEQAIDNNYHPYKNRSYPSKY